MTNTLLRSRNTVFACCAFLIICYAFALLSSCSKDAKPTPGDGLLTAASLTSTGSLSAVASRVDTGGLVAWYSFDSGSLKDISSYHNRIIFNNAQPATDRNGVANNAYYFNGNGSYMEIKNSPSLSPADEITLFAIVKFDDFYAGLCHGNRILNKGFYDGDPGFYNLGCSDGYYAHSMNCSQAVDKAHETFESGFCNTGAGDTTAFIQTAHWYHIVYTYANRKARFYVDGRLTDSLRNTALQPSAGNVNVFIGTTNKANTEYPYWLNGTVDQIAIFNKALNAAQVARLSVY